jgi:two-component system response regulator AtoC
VGETEVKLKAAKQTILIVDDDRMIRWTLGEALRGWGYLSVEAGTVAEALPLFDSEQPAAMLLDIDLPDGSGLDVLRDIKGRQPDAVIIMITGDVAIENTIAALRGGAYDFIGKPINLEELRVTIRNGIEAHHFRQEIGQARRERERAFSFEQIIGESPAIRRMLQMARKVAKAIHYSSRRTDARFVAINTAAIPANLLESELFGYEKGAFTDAKTRKEGLFEQAEGGTLFLDEIGELDLGLQAKLLRVLEEGAFRRVGGLRDVPFDARIIAASNRDLKSAAEEGSFRLDLYYRLSVIQINIPPLRERGDDILLLANHYIKWFNERLRRKVKGLSPDVVKAFLNYRFPGNVRELRNIIERVLILEEGDTITLDYLSSDLSATPLSAEFRLPPQGISLGEVEASFVRQALEKSGGHQTKAAELLGISRDQLRYRLKKLDGGEGNENES